MIISLLRQEITDIHSHVAPVNLYELAHHSIHYSSAKWLGVVHGPTTHGHMIFEFHFTIGPSIQCYCSFLAFKWKTENTVNTVTNGPKNFGPKNG